MSSYQSEQASAQKQGLRARLVYQCEVQVLETGDHGLVELTCHCRGSCANVSEVAQKIVGLLLGGNEVNSKAESGLSVLDLTCLADTGFPDAGAGSDFHGVGHGSFPKDHLPS